MEIWLDVKNVAGTIVGSGPITTAMNWHQEKRLDEAGSFTLDMPASDARWLNIVSKGTVECNGLVGGAVTMLGAGVVDEIEDSVGDPAMVHIAGGDLLTELARYIVGDMAITEKAWVFLTDNRGAVRNHRALWIAPPAGGVGWRQNQYSASVDLPQAYDGDVDTPTGTIYLTGLHNDIWETQDWIYFGADFRFDDIDIIIGTANSTQAATLKLQCLRPDVGWEDVVFTDGTDNGGKPFGKSGHISFTAPSDWQRAQAMDNAGNWFWCRACLVERAWGSYVGIEFALKEVKVYADVPTKKGVQLIMAAANAQSGGAWDASAAVETTTEAYMEFSGETCLAALIALAKVTGDHFMLGTGRAISWIGPASGWSACGYRAVNGLTGVDAESNAEALLITGCSEIKDTYGVITRITPFTGTGATRIDLASTTRSAAAGYTLNKAPTSPEQPYLANDAAEAAYGIINKVEHFDNIELVEKNSWYAHPAYAADCLFDIAYNFLRTHCVPVYHYALTVVGLRALLNPASTIHAVCQIWTDGVKTTNINTYPSSPLLIMAVSYDVGTDGPLLAGLEVSNLERQLETGADATVDTIRDVGQVLLSSGKSTITNSYNVIHNDIVSNNTRITGGTIDGTKIGAVHPTTAIFRGLTSIGATWINGYTVVGDILDIVIDQGILRTALAAGTTTIDFGRPVTPDDYVMIRSVEQYPYEFVKVGVLDSGTTYNVTRGTDGTDAANWPANSIWILLGHEGQGRMRLRSEGLPRFTVYEQGATADDYTVKAVLGDITGLTGVTGTQWGLWTENGYFTGTITATAGDIGGWDIGATSITADSGAVGLSSAATAGNDIRIWAGHATPGSAPFRVYEDGSLVASDATISGEITAESGSIGGFDIGEDYLRDAANTFGLASTVTGGDDVRFWAGAAFADRASAPLRLYESGVVHVVNGEFGGTIVDNIAMGASGSITIDTDAVVIDADGITLRAVSVDDDVMCVLKYADDGDYLCREFVVTSEGELTDICKYSIVYSRDTDSVGHAIIASASGVGVTSNVYLAARAASGNASITIDSADEISIVGDIAMASGNKLTVDHIGEAEAAHGVVIDNQLDATTIHTTTLLADHIGEHTGSHDIVLDNPLECKQLVYTRGSTLTISGGAIAVTNSFHIIDTEGSAASDDLDTITGSEGSGTMLLLHTSDNGRDVVIKRTGNIYTDTGGDLTLGTRTTYAYLHWDNDRGKWCASIKVYS